MIFFQIYLTGWIVFTFARWISVAEGAAEAIQNLTVWQWVVLGAASALVSVTWPWELVELLFGLGNKEL